MASPVYTRYRTAFADALARALGVPATEIESQVKPADPAHGDLSFPTFALAKAQKKAPPAIAAALAPQVQVPGLEVVATGPYVNARFSVMPFTGEVLEATRREGVRYGADPDVGKGEKVVIDYSSPNIAKPFAFHHIRTTVIGHALANLHRLFGYEVHGINYLGDWGKQFGLVAVGFEEYGDPARRREVAHLVEVYIKANERADKDPAFDDRARAFFKRMEAGDAEALAFWKDCRELTVGDLRAIYARLGIEFEHYEGESFYQGKMDPALDLVARTVGVRESEGALVVDLPYKEGEPAILLKKKDGTTLYITRDIAAAMDRWERFHFARSLYVVATDQALHFRQLFLTLEKMGLEWSSRCQHVNFGRVHGMSTRKGTMRTLADVLDEAHRVALQKVTENVAAGRIQTDDPEVLAEQIGIGAIVFGDLKNKRTADYDFDLEAFTSFEGHTGAYLQYAYARTRNVLRKGGGAPATFDPALLTLPEEQALVRALAQLPVVMRQALAELEPSLVSRHMLEVASEFSRYFTAGNQDRDKRVLVEGEDKAAVRAARLALTDATRATLAAGLQLLGIPTPESM